MTIMTIVINRGKANSFSRMTLMFLFVMDIVAMDEIGQDFIITIVTV